MITISEHDILRRFQDDEAPQLARLDGVPGSGKTTLLRHVVYEWSQDFLKLEGESVILDEQTGPFSLMVYLSARSVRHNTIQEAIYNALWCRKEDKDVLMEHVRMGTGVAIVIDATDELKSDAAMKKLTAFIQDTVTQGRHKILLATRTDLCRIDASLFDRVLVLQEFNLPQSKDYITNYFPPGPPPVQPHPVVSYIQTNQRQLEAVLCNPLRLHIFCELTSRRVLKLQPDETFDLMKLLKPLERYLIKRELQKDETMHESTEDAERFYRMSLYGMLTNTREFAEAVLADFEVSRLYREAFLTKKIEFTLDAEVKTYYSFCHEVMYEYFASCYVNTASVSTVSALLSHICREDSLRNVQKISAEMISRRPENQGRMLLEKMIQAILVPQMLETPNTSAVSIEQILKYHQGEDKIKEANEVWDRIDKDFGYYADELRIKGGFHDLEQNGTIHHVIDCLRMLPVQLQEEIIRKTIYQLLPCQYTDVLK